MLYGTIANYFPAKRFGFIKADYGPDVYFDWTALGACQEVPRIEVGQPVKYELVPGTEPKRRRFKAGEDGVAEEPARPRALMVELMDKPPGAVLRGFGEQYQSSHHPKSRRKKPSWRK